MWSPFKFDDFDAEELPGITTDRCPDEAIVIADEEEEDNDIFKTCQFTTESCKSDSIFNELDDIELSDEVDEEPDVEECGDCSKSPFEEAANIFFLESVFGDNDDEIAGSVDDMADDDDPEIDADVEGIEEIEQDIIDDEEDDLIDAAMVGE